MDSTFTDEKAEVNCVPDIPVKDTGVNVERYYEHIESIMNGPNKAKVPKLVI